MCMHYRADSLSYMGKGGRKVETIIGVEWGHEYPNMRAPVPVGNKACRGFEFSCPHLTLMMSYFSHIVWRCTVSYEYLLVTSQLMLTKVHAINKVRLFPAKNITKKAIKQQSKE